MCTASSLFCTDLPCEWCALLLCMWLKAVLHTRNFPCNLCCNFVATQVAREIVWCNLQYPAILKSCNILVAASVMQIRTKFYFLQHCCAMLQVTIFLNIAAQCNTPHVTCLVIICMRSQPKCEYRWIWQTKWLSQQGMCSKLHGVTSSAVHTCTAKQYCSFSNCETSSTKTKVA